MWLYFLESYNAVLVLEKAEAVGTFIKHASAVNDIDQLQKSGSISLFAFS